MNYRAAYYAPANSAGIALTTPEQSDLSDTELMAAARAELEKVGVPDGVSIDDAMADVQIGQFRD